MKVREVRAAIEGLNDDAEVVLWIKGDEFISQFEEVGFKLDTIQKSTEGDSHLDVFVSVFDAEDFDDDDNDDNIDEFLESRRS